MTWWKYALNYLLGLKISHSKMDNLVYSELKLQNYLKSGELPVHEANNLFRFRVRVAPFKENFKEKYKQNSPICPFCLLYYRHTILLSPVCQSKELGKS